MMRNILAIIFLISCFSCSNKEDRDHLIFKGSTSLIEGNMQLLDSLLPDFPPQQNLDWIQSYYYETEDGDSILFINAVKVGNINNVKAKTIARHLNMNESQSSKFLRASLVLLRNNISHCLFDKCGWTYVYKFSNDRGEYRPVLYNYKNTRTQFMEDSCGFEVIDRKGKIILLKEK